MSDRLLWDFAVALYSCERVASLCLDWQDRLGVDVPVLLFACWAAAEGRTLSPPDIAAAAATVAPWRAGAIEPLRGIRRRLKEDPLLAAPAEASRVRDLVKTAELEAERVALVLLESRLPSVGPAVVADVEAMAAENIAVAMGHFAGVSRDSEEASRNSLASAVAALAGKQP